MNLIKYLCIVLSSIAAFSSTEICGFKVKIFNNSDITKVVKIKGLAGHDSEWVAVAAKSSIDIGPGLTNFIEGLYIKNVDDTNNKRYFPRKLAVAGNVGFIIASVEGDSHFLSQKFVKKYSDVTQQLFDAVSAGDLTRVTAAIVAGANVKVRNNEGETPLFIAARKANLNIVKVLLAAADNDKAYVNQYDNSGRTPLCITHNVDIVKTLIAAGADVRRRDNGGRTPLLIASRNGNLDVVKTLLAAAGNDTAYVNRSDNGSRTPLYEACDKGKTDIVKVLIAAGADVTVVIWGMAIEKGDVGMVKVLASAGVEENDRRLLLKMAIKKGNADIIKILAH